jgi:tetratricopeptide (TPR) repeat protein
VFAAMRLRPALVRLVSFLLLLQCLALSQALGQHSTPIKKKGLTDALATGGLSVAELTKIIEERGVDFRLTYDNAEELRKAGATDPILNSVRNHYRHAPSPQADRAKAASLVKSSRALFDAHNPTSALPVVNEALDLDPDNADAYVLRAQIYYSSGDANRGQADANIALQIAPGNREAKQLLQNGKGQEIATASPNNGNNSSTSNSGTEIPSAGRAGFLGFRLQERNGVYVVIGALPFGSASRGGVLTGDVTLSANGLTFKDFYDQVLTPGKLAPGQAVNVQIQRQGQTLTLQLVALPRPNAGAEAIGYYGQMIQQFPGNAEAYLYRAAAYEQVKNYPAALADANTFLRLNPSDAQGLAQRAAIKDAMGDKQGAQADMAAANNLNAPQNAQTNPPQGNVPQNNGGQNNGQTNNTPAGDPALPLMWTLLEYNQAYKITQNEDHLYFLGVGVLANGEAGKTTDKKGNVIYKGKWHLTNANGSVSVWNFVLKKVTPQRIEGTVLTLGFTGQAVTFVPLQ